MRIEQILETTYPCLSVEFFPPKDDAGVEALFATLQDLKRFDLGYVSVTYGAGGSTRDKTIGIVDKIRRDHEVEAMAHLTCVEATVDDLLDVLGDIKERGIENVLALRGDPPQGQDVWTATPGGLTNAADLTGLISENHECSIGAACFPEVHPEADDLESDLKYLKRKVDAGAGFLITQLFFESNLYFEFVARARAIGIDVPIIPGVMPIRSFAQITRFAKLCGASIPEPLAEQMSALDGDEDAEGRLGIAYATQQCADLLAGGAPGIHLYALNRVPAAQAVLGALRASRPWERRERQAPALVPSPSA